MPRGTTQVVTRGTTNDCIAGSGGGVAEVSRRSTCLTPIGGSGILAAVNDEVPGLNLQNTDPDLRTMEELLEVPTVDIGDAIVVLPILANQFELKIGLLNLVTAISFHGFANDDPHFHIRRFMKKDLVSKFANQLFPPSRTTNLRNEITRFQQKFDESFSEAWERFKDLLNKCPHHGFYPLHQVDTFYNGLNQSDQDSLNLAAGGNFLTRNTQEALTIIENKYKVRTSRNKPQVSSANGSSSQNDAITTITKQVKALVSSMNKPIHSIQEGCETCGGPHSYFECQAASGYTQNERPLGVLPSNTIPNPQEDIKVIITQSGMILARPSVLSSPSSSSKEVERYPKTITDQYFLKKKLILHEITPTRITLELVTQMVVYLAGIVEDVFVQVGKFTFPADFVVVDYDIDPRVPLILGRPFLRTACSLVDVHGEELTLRVSDEKLVLNFESTLKYPQKDGDESIHMIDILDTTCEDYFHEVLNVQKSIHPLSGTPNPSIDLVVESLSPSLTLFGDSDFLLDEADAFLSLGDSIPSGIDNGIYESKGDPPDLELKDLPPHLNWTLSSTSPPPSSSKEVERDLKMVTDQLLPSPASSPSELPKRNPHQPLIPYPSSLNKEKLQDKSDIQVHKFL
nr:hypothetical protein [Tanacetum cinerariifolium]